MHCVHLLIYSLLGPNACVPELSDLDEECGLIPERDELPVGPEVPLLNHTKPLSAKSRELANAAPVAVTASRLCDSIICQALLSAPHTYVPL